MYKLPAAFLFALVSGCASMDYSPPKPVYEAWKKNPSSVEEVKADMRLCGYQNLGLANDLSQPEAAKAEQCMVAKGYSLDLRSYRPNNCYGSNSPYLCNRLWGGQKPQTIRVDYVPK